MTSNSLQISVLPQAKNSKKTTRAKSPLSLSILPTTESNKKPKTKIPPTDFANILLSASTTQTQQAKTDSKNPSPLPNAAEISRTQRSKKIKLISSSLSQKPSLTQNQPEVQKKLSQISQNNLREALLSKNVQTLPSKQPKQKTLGDLQKIANDHQLNLAKLEISTQPEIKTRKKQDILQSPQQVPLPTKQKERIVLQDTSPQNTQKTRKMRRDLSSIKQTQTTPSSQQNLVSNQPSPQHSLSSPQAPLLALKESALTDLLTQKPQAEALKLEEKTTEEKKSDKVQDFLTLDPKKETQFKIAQSKETLSHFTQRIKEEIANYKPPFTKLSMDLNPQELGKLEVTITKKGKDLQIQINANNQNALQAFIQNQSEFKATLANAGFGNIELNFSGGDSQGQQKRQEDQNQKGNKNSLDNFQDAPLATSMEINMVQYA
ncbi:flagellar hook-length control protein FliK [Helicobacter kayseriensis]|uniref:flagellar hook-length control protein FliK n=1 Tax=Helicobacter kayseriensis TaxID=2905877 RepID=UPI001E55F2FB|nr:flagellar hook-length control protein FliK [Helicobacter kayseriensis]MCE3047071.1 flagellar hook-length control protein FliK [Helicobacter kayseriensis]MCE3048269.1 flagellar hook-length control protein FliK [Helicobacter kayseriensis]